MGHDENYIFDLQDKTPDYGFINLDSDTVLSPLSYDAALHAVGAVCNAVDDIFSGNTSRSFCAMRPPGHHAEPDKAMGFCLMNNIFIGARYAQEKYGIKKIAIVDFDVHHGNGTDTMCRAHNKIYPDNPIFYISTHDTTSFPMTGLQEDNNDNILNLPLPEKCDSDGFRDLYKKSVLPALNNFAPDFLMLSAGFDAHKDDPLAPAQLETEDYGWVTRQLCDIATKHNQSKVISVLEGGYDIPALIASVSAHLEELLT